MKKDFNQVLQTTHFTTELYLLRMAAIITTQTLAHNCECKHHYSHFQ
jgi:hypothetical protein